LRTTGGWAREAVAVPIVAGGRGRWSTSAADNRGGADDGRSGSQSSGWVAAPCERVAASGRAAAVGRRAAGVQPLSQRKCGRGSGMGGRARVLGIPLTYDSPNPTIVV
jgi:hypothetical protein